MKKDKKIKGNARYIIKVAILAAMAGMLMLIEFPLGFAPSFYKMDLSDLPAMIGGFALGPVAAAIIEFLKNVIHILIKGTSTAFVGELANFVTSCALVVPAALIYKYKKSFTGAIIGMIAGTATIAVVGSLMNYFILIPTFSKLYHLPLDSIIAMGTSANESITNLKTLVLFAVVPFNLLKGVICSLITLPIYKRVSPLLHR